MTGKKQSNCLGLLIASILIFAIPSDAFSFELFAKDYVRIDLKGYYKNLLTISETNLKQDYYSDLNRLRFDFNISLASKLSVKIAYDHDLIFGSILNTNEFAVLKDQGTDTYYRLDAVLADRSEIYWRHSFYRLYLRYTEEKMSLTAGKQRIALGVGKIWNPEDIINPSNPLSIEREERAGSDAIQADFHFGTFSGTSFIYARKESEHDFVIKPKTNFKGYDISALTGLFGKKSVIGFDFSGYIGDTGLRGEGTYTFHPERRNFFRFDLSWDYTFLNSLYILMEYFYNGGNIRNGGFLNQLSGEISTRNRNFLDINIGYDITPLIKFDTLSIWDIYENSIFINPSVKYNIFEGIDWLSGVQLFMGKPDGEYDKLPNFYYTQIQWYF
ncbi:MAG: hypothetical protein HZA13_03775 [Nitrospirae bacterium]|nr:hypothetical protein [Nitrospirota bacterium]